MTRRPLASTAPRFDRRSCLRGAVAAASGVWLQHGPAARAGQDTTDAAGPSESGAGGIPVVDTHLHCFAGADEPKFPYHPRAPYRPDEPASPQHLLECMRGADVDYAIVVHPEPYQDNHQYLEYCLEQGEGRLKGTCLFFADRPQSLARLPRFLARHPQTIVAARMHAYVPTRLPPFGQREMRTWWRAVADAGRAVQLHFEPRYAAGFEPYIREFADTTVIIDHLGRPMQGTREDHDRVVAWSDLPNTIMKLSSIPFPERYPHRDASGIIERLTRAWGADRMMYGGGFNSEATAASYRSYRERLRNYLTHLSETEQAMIFGGTADRLFKFSG